MKNKYTKTNWVDGKTPVNSVNLGKIENALEDLYTNAPGKSQITGDGSTIETKISDSGDVKISLIDKNIQKSHSCTGLEVSDSDENLDPDKVSLVLDPETKELRSIYFKGIKIYEVG